MFRRIALLTLVFAGVAQATAPTKQSSRPVPALDLFFRATALDDRTADAALTEISAGWKGKHSISPNVNKLLKIEEKVQGFPPRVVEGFDPIRLEPDGERDSLCISQFPCGSEGVINGAGAQLQSQAETESGDSG